MWSHFNGNCFGFSEWKCVPIFIHLYDLATHRNTYKYIQIYRNKIHFSKLHPNNMSFIIIRQLNFCLLTSYSHLFIFRLLYFVHLYFPWYISSCWYRFIVLLNVVLFMEIIYIFLFNIQFNQISFLHKPSSSSPSTSSLPFLCV